MQLQVLLRRHRIRAVAAACAVNSAGSLRGLARLDGIEMERKLAQSCVLQIKGSRRINKAFQVIPDEAEISIFPLNEYLNI